MSAVQRLSAAFGESVIRGFTVHVHIIMIIGYLITVYNKCTLYTEVQVSTLFTQLRAEGPRLRRDRTEVYNGLVPWAMHVAITVTTHPHPSNDRAGDKSQLERHPATVRIVMKKLASIKAYHRPMAEPVKKA